ncbi:aggregation-promoting factor C-terminal-like domain-containing protein [Lactobacillus gasseri]|uniref:aggregation-promoting factor C-terminal-like domain-containing protein n=1 Tax=Lactobacillus gasseri TaxID=1596 RepID=UPI0029C1ABCF|nr:tape measure protein [Lactobacillus gasseri]MDX5065626.1 tape measure protein [Lactobacillus gasseri]MDX5082281.1 tape measure protein [Lactobacillus gasseri]
MADGRITIDIDIPVDKVKTDAQLIDQILNSVGRDAGKELDSSFEESTDKVKQKADETSKDVDEKLSKPVDIKANLDNKDVQEKTNQTKRNLDSVPKETKTEQKADNKDAVEKARQAKEEIDKVPDRKNSKLDSTDNTKKATDSASRNADNAGKHFSKLHEIIKGTFIGNFAANAAQTALGTIKNAIGGVITEGTHYNRLQQDMLAQWNTLTGSAGKGKELVKETNDLAIAAQNSVEMVNDLNQKFYAVTNSSSKTRDLSKAVLTLQDAFGQSDDAVKNFAMQWSQMIGNGKANAQDMMSIQNVFPKFMEELVEYERKVTHNSKLTTAQVRDMMSNGKISADAMNTVLIGMGKKYKNATDNFSQTMDGMERTIHARIPVLAGAIVKPFQDLKNPLLGKMSNWITSSGAEKSFENFGKSIAGIMNGVMTVINTFAMSFRANIAGAFQGSHLGDIGNSFRDIGKAVTPALQAIAGFVGVISADIFKVFTTQISGIVNGFKNVGKQKSSLNFSGVTKAFQSLSQAINAVYSYLIPLNKRIGEFVGIFAKGAIAGIVTVFQDISGAIGKVTSKITELIPPVQNTDKAVDGVTKHRAGIEKLGKVFGGLIAVILTGKATFSVLNGMKSGIESLGKAISAIKNAPGIIAKISKAFPALGKAFGALKAVFMANPFMATVAVIAALGLAFYEAYKHIKPFREWVNKATDTVHKSFDGMVRNIQAFNKSFVNGLKVVIDWVKKNWPTLLRMLVDPIGGGLKLLYDNNPKFKKWVDDLGKNISNGWSSIKKNTSKFFTDLPKNISKGMKAAIDWIKKNWSGLTLLMVAPIAGAIKLLYDNNPKFKKWVDNLGQNLKKGFDGMLKNSHNFFKGLWTGIGNWGKQVSKNWGNFVKELSENRYVKAFKKGNLFGTLFKDAQSRMKDFGKKWDKAWKNNKKALADSFSNMQSNINKWGTNTHKWYDKFNKQFKKKWDNGWKNNKQALIDSFDRMKQNTSNWGNNIHKWYDNFNKNFSKNWNRGWSDTRKNLSTAWSKMQDRTSRFGSDMQNWLNNFGPNFKAGWKSLSKGVQNIFGDMWTAMKKLGKDAMGGLIDIVNAGISGINTVIYAFGGKGDTIKKIPKKFASGTGAFSGPRRAITEPTLAMVNDGFDSPETGNKEALFRPATGEFGVFQGRNNTTMLMPGDEILNASETAMIMQGMGITHFAKGTGWLGNITNSVGSFFGGIGSWVKDKVDDLKKYFDLAKKIISNPTQYVESIFNFKGFNSGQRSMKALASGLFDQANKNVQSFWKTLWNMVSGQFNGGAANSDLLAAAQKYGSGHPYVWGAKGADAFDCSGLVQYAVEHAFHKSFPAGSSAQYAATQNVDNPQPGDLVFFGAGGANHVGIYAGGDNYYSAQSPSASPNIGMGKISAVHEGPVSYRRIPGINALGKSGDNVKANSGLEKWIKKTIAPGFWKFIDKLNSLFNVSIGSGGPNSAPTGDHKHWLKQAGIPESWFNGLNSIIQQESGWRVNATNPSSGAYGIPQSLPGNKMASAGSDWRTNPITQLKWMYSYIKERYGGLQNALSFRAAHGWYGNGGEFDSPKVIGVGEDGSEFVINPQKSTADHLIDKAILQRAKVAPESPTASLARIMDQVKYSSIAGYGTPDSSTIASQNIIKLDDKRQKIDGDTVIKFIVSDKEMARATYPTIKMLQAHDITIKQQGGAIPVV